MVLIIAAIALLLSAPVYAHFKVTAPPARFKSEALMVFPPCGGVPLGQRTPFPISGGIVEGVSYHPSANLNFSMAITDSDPDVKVGTNATLRIVYEAGDGLLHQCVDVTFTAALKSSTSPVTTTLPSQQCNHAQLPSSLVTLITDISSFTVSPFIKLL
ncbi:hypothetical protein BC829DRAFT_387792 [Chytridium lagenaria]|nr:hypothetical protein BC829DRAFT_387792 [Chytridium lagenaria]